MTRLRFRNQNLLRLFSPSLSLSRSHSISKEFSENFCNFFFVFDFEQKREDRARWWNWIRPQKKWQDDDDNEYGHNLSTSHIIIIIFVLVDADVVVIVFFSVTWLGDFLVLLENIIWPKVAKIFYKVLGYFQTNYFLFKNLLWPLFGKFWKHFAFFSFQHLVTLVFFFFFYCYPI